MMGFLSLLRFLPLALAVSLTTRAQALWLANNPFVMFLPVLLWSVLLIGWTIQQSRQYQLQEKPKLRDLTLPFCLSFVIICSLTNAPLHVLFWSQKSALKEALDLPEMPRTWGGERERIGLFHPLQISKSGRAVRFLLWEDQGFISTKLLGFAYCPNDEGCHTASFAGFYAEGDSSPD
ncbi:MAG: hypothetical protein EOO38_19705, partial [Cytophagaceae bacterium]